MDTQETIKKLEKQLPVFFRRAMARAIMCAVIDKHPKTTDAKSIAATVGCQEANVNRYFRRMRDLRLIRITRSKSGKRYARWALGTELVAWINKADAATPGPQMGLPPSNAEAEPDTILGPESAPDKAAAIPAEFVPFVEFMVDELRKERIARAEADQLAESYANDLETTKRALGEGQEVIRGLRRDKEVIQGMLDNKRLSKLSKEANEVYEEMGRKPH